jgi:AAA15 family ATPase/GTPase
MGYIQQLTIDKFRGLKKLEISDLGVINLFVGANNSGKTSVLEAIELFNYPFDISNYAKVARMRDLFNVRSLPLIDYITWLFPKRGLAAVSIENQNEMWDSIYIEALIDDKKNRFTVKPTIKKSLKSNLDYNKENESSSETEQSLPFDDFSTEIIRILELNVRFEQDSESTNRKLVFTDHIETYTVKQNNSLIKSLFITPIEHRIRLTSAKAIHDVIVSGDRPKIISILKLFDENIQGIELLSPDGRFPIPALNHKKLGIVPIFLFGDGVRKALTLASAVVRSEGGVLLIDELETAIHPTALSSLFSWLVEACKLFNVQLFATTHSLEATDAILKASKECLNQLVIYRLETSSDKTIVKRLSGETSFSLRYELGQDVR